MKKIIGVLTVFLLFISCEKPSDCFEKTGNSVSRVYEVTEANEFNKIYVEKGVSLIIKEGTEFKIEVFTGENLLDNISVEFNPADHTLRLKDNSSCNWTRSYGQIKFYVTTPHLESLDIVSTTEQDIDSDGILTHGILRLISMDLGPGAGTNDFHIQVENGQTVVENNNVSRFYLSGHTNQALLNLYDGNGRIQAENLIAQEVVLFHRGSNDMVVYPVQKIKGKMVSTGNVVLKNIPLLPVEVEQLYHGRVIYP